MVPQQKFKQNMTCIVLLFKKNYYDLNYTGLPYRFPSLAKFI